MSFELFNIVRRSVINTPTGDSKMIGKKDGPTREVFDSTDPPRGFKPSELMLGFKEWHALSEYRRSFLRPETREWLGAWTMFDLACSPMDDGRRRVIRYGHYLGWHEERQDKTMDHPGDEDVYSWIDPVAGQRCAAVRGAGQDPSAELIFSGASAREIFRLQSTVFFLRSQAVLEASSELDRYAPCRVHETALSDDGPCALQSGIRRPAVVRRKSTDVPPPPRGEGGG